VVLPRSRWKLLEEKTTSGPIGPEVRAMCGEAGGLANCWLGKIPESDFIMRHHSAAISFFSSHIKMENQIHPAFTELTISLY